MRRVLILALSLPLLAACNSITGNGSNKLLQFYANRQGPAPRDSMPSFAAASGGAILTVAGEIVTLCANYSLNRSARQSGSTITLRVTWDVREPCQDSTTFWTYTAQLGRFSPGVYSLEVIQNTYDAATDDFPVATAYQQQITVQ